MRVDHRQLPGPAPAEPALQQRTPHLARADQQDGAGQRIGHASPSVSNMALSSASRGDLPAQSTNWNAWK